MELLIKSVQFKDTEDILNNIYKRGNKNVV